MDQDARGGWKIDEVRRVGWRSTESGRRQQVSPECSVADSPSTADWSEPDDELTGAVIGMAGAAGAFEQPGP